jgi:hypothetical protein
MNTYGMYLPSRAQHPEVIFVVPVAESAISAITANHPALFLSIVFTQDSGL